MIQKVELIGQDEIRSTNSQTTADALAQHAEVYVQKSQMGGGSPVLRGLEANRILLVVDGVRMNNAIFRGGNLQNVISIDPFIINKTEVILGSGSVIYGSDAMGGVMSFYTKTPELSYKDSLHLKIDNVLRYASANGERTGHTDVNLGFNKWASLTSFSYSSFDDLRMGKNGPEEYLRNEYVETINNQDTIIQNRNPKIQKPTAYDQWNFMQRFRYEPSEKYTYNLGLMYSTTSSYPRYDRLLRYRNNTLRSALWEYGPQQWFLGYLQLTVNSSSSNLHDKMQVSVAYQNFNESRSDRDYQSIFKNIREEAVDAFSASIDLEKTVSNKTQLFYGVEYIFNKVHSSGTEKNIVENETVSAISRYPNGADWQSAAVYSHIKYKPNTKFVFQSGLRYNYIRLSADFSENNEYLNLPYSQTKINSGAITGTAGFNWKPSNLLQWSLNFTSAFRAPNIDDIGKVFDSEPGSVVVPNNNLKPEYAYGGELGLDVNIQNVFKLRTSLYYTYLNNALVRRDYQLNGQSQILYDGELSNVQAIQNAAKAWIYGFETTVEVNFTEDFLMRSQYNFINGTEEDDSGVEVPVRHAPPAFGNTHLIWDYNGFKVDAFLEYNGELSNNQLTPSEIAKDYIYAKDENGNPYMPSWYTLNTRLQYQLNTNTMLTFSVENITDQRYKTYSSGIASPGRNFIIAARYNL
jgi:hemoglobin/transferrin/lactoferrin receptor protein